MLLAVQRLLEAKYTLEYAVNCQSSVACQGAVYKKSIDTHFRR